MGSSRAQRRKQAKREREAAAAAEEPPTRAPRDGLPQVVRTNHNIDLAVLPSAAAKARQAPVKDGLDAFLKKALYGGGVKRVSSSTMASLKPQARRPEHMMLRTRAKAECT